MPREIVRLPFGRGLERGAGAFVTDPTTFRDLRNVHLRDAVVRLRRGLSASATIGGGVTDIIAVHPLRGTQQSMLVCYDSATRAVTAQRVTIDPTTLAVTLTSVPGTIWTIPPTAPFPRVTVTDSYGLAFIAHDEASYSLRQTTKVYDPNLGTYSNLLWNQDGAGPMNLRGVQRWLSYVVGWGYGTPDSGPPDDRHRPEVVRVSMPGDPEVWPAEFYFLCGQRDEPVLAGAGLEAGFIVAKEGELHLITGTSRLDFDITMIDPYFGAVSQQACVVVGDTFFFWSAEGPRATTGGASMELGRALNLRGTLPDEVLNDADYRYAFAFYRPEADEIEWCWPAPGRDATWSYVFDRSSGEATWLYRKYGRLVRAAGLLAGNIAFDPTDPLVAPYPTLTSFSLNAGGWYTHTVNWQNNNSANLSPGTKAELWVAGGTGSFVVDPALPWTKATEVTASGATQSETALIIGDFASGQVWRHVAIRYRRADGTYDSGQASANPMDWPANTRLSIQAAARPEIASTVASWGGSPDITTPLTVDWTNQDVTRLDAGTDVEIWGMGSEALGGPGIAPDTWAIEATVAASGATQQRTNIIIGQQRRHVALRYKKGGKYYSHSQASDPWTWPAASRSSLLLDGPRPILTFAWDTVSGYPRSPGTLTITMPDNLIAPSGNWTLEVYRFVWDPSLGYAVDAIPNGAWSLTPEASYPYNPQPPNTQTHSVSALNPTYKLVYAARMLLNGTARPSTYVTGQPMNWPAVSRLTITSL